MQYMGGHATPHKNRSLIDAFTRDRQVDRLITLCRQPDNGGRLSVPDMPHPHSRSQHTGDSPRSIRRIVLNIRFTERHIGPVPIRRTT